MTKYDAQLYLVKKRHALRNHTNQKSILKHIFLLATK